MNKLNAYYKNIKNTCSPLFFMQKRKFNEKTINNIFNYLEENKSKLKYFKNESGFIRTTLPNWIYVPSIMEQPSLTANFKLRINYWSPSINCHLVESIHDHPSSFQSFIVHGGYQHKVFVPATTNWNSLDLLTSNFTMNREKTLITYQGKVTLTPTLIQQTNIGDVVTIGDNTIHRVMNYNYDALTINKVSLNEGKGFTNLFLLENKASLVKAVREELNTEQSLEASESMIRLFKSC